MINELHSFIIDLEINWKHQRSTMYIFIRDRIYRVSCILVSVHIRCPLSFVFTVHTIELWFPGAVTKQCAYPLVKWLTAFHALQARDLACIHRSNAVKYQNTIDLWLCVSSIVTNSFVNLLCYVSALKILKHFCLEFFANVTSNNTRFLLSLEAVPEFLRDLYIFNVNLFHRITEKVFFFFVISLHRLSTLLLFEIVWVFWVTTNNDLFWSRSCFVTAPQFAERIHASHL